jgi:hypothetical protein
MEHVGLVAFRDGGGSELLHELKRLHGPGLTGEFLTVLSLFRRDQQTAV